MNDTGTLFPNTCALVVSDHQLIGNGAGRAAALLFKAKTWWQHTLVHFHILAQLTVCTS